MHFAFLPLNGEIWLCHVFQGVVLPLALAPGSSGAVRRFGGDGCEFGVLDHDGKRLAHYRLLRQAPWFETVHAPAFLPKFCVAQALLAHEGMLLAGGASKQGGALWTRRPQRQPDWVNVSLPVGVGRHGKAIDALFVHQGELVAIDYKLCPKWILVYPLQPEPNAGAMRQYRLKTHTTYERILYAAEGQEIYVLLSRGINHGIISYHLSAICKKELKEVSHRFGVPAAKTQDLINEVKFDIALSETLANWGDELPVLTLLNATLKEYFHRERIWNTKTGSLLAAIQDMAFCARYLLVALGSHGLGVTLPHFVASTATNTSTLNFGDFCLVPLSKVMVVQRLELVPGAVDGVYAVGTDNGGVLTSEWVGVGGLQLALTRGTC